MHVNIDKTGEICIRKDGLYFTICVGDIFISSQTTIGIKRIIFYY